MMDFYLCIVLYNKDFDTSETLQSISKWSKEWRNNISKLLIWDNSPKAIKKSIIDQKSDDIGIAIDYFHDGRNHSLSSIYNKTIDLLPPNGILVLLDHDSDISEDYIKELDTVVMQNPDVNLFLPQIIYSEQLVSPSWTWYFLGKYLDHVDSGLKPSKNTMAINSGMAIRINYLKNVYEGYNEKIKFYGTDNDFMMKYAHTNKYLYVMKTQIHHILNFYDDKDVKKNKDRAKDIKNGIIEVLKERNKLLVPFARCYWSLFYIKNFLLKK